MTGGAHDWRRMLKLIVRTLVLTALCFGVASLGLQVSTVRASGRPAAVVASGGETTELLGGLGRGHGDDRYRLSALTVFSNVALHVKDHYVEPDRVVPSEMLQRALEEIERQIAEVLVHTEGNRISIEVMGKTKTVVNDVQNLWEINLKLRDVFRFFEKNLPPQEDMRLIEYAAINGALSTLDPHSILLRPEAFAEMKTSTKGEFGGLGIVISLRDGRLTIISPIDGTPASRAGLEAGDVISRIGDVSTVSMPVDEAVQLLRGPRGSKVTIWVDRTGWSEPKQFSMVREQIKLESVESELLSDGVGYIKVKSFQQNTGRDLEEHLEKLEKSAKGKLRGLVLDLRNNPGGLLEQATRISDKFLTSGDIVTTVGYGNKLREPKRARWSGTKSDLPLAVLVNRGSASASEIVAGALKNLDRATIIGETTFGKGSVQVLYDFADRSALKLTIAQYLTPGDVSIQNEGVEPDIRLMPTWISERSVRRYYEDESHRERSLERHLERAGRTPVEPSRPTYSFGYLVRGEQEAEDGEEEPVRARDFPVEFARRYLLSTANPTRTKSLARARTLVETTAGAEERAMMERLEKLGVDWTRAPRRSPRAPALEARLELKGEPLAGSEVEVVATVTNHGPEPVHRVHGVLRSENAAFEGRELMFGAVPPGGSRTWSVRTRLPRDDFDRTDPVRMTLEAEDQLLPIEASVAVHARRVPKPVLAATWVFDDRERGDGDGLLEAGEGVEFEVLVTNVGDAPAEQVSVRLKSGAKEDLFLERGRARIGALAPGETGRASLRFRVPESPSGSLLPIEVAVYDPPTGAWLESRVDLTFRPRAPSPSERIDRLKRTRRATTVHQGAAANSAVIGVLPPGAVVPAEAKYGSWFRVRLPSGAPAFVRRAAMEAAAKGAREDATVAYHPMLLAPKVRIEGEPGAAPVVGPRLTLTGEVLGRSLRDMFITLNEDKLYFERFAGDPAASATGEVDGWRKPSDEAARIPFSVPLDLQEGLNRITVVARVDDKLVTQRTIFVSRSAATAAVAERREGSP